MFLGFTRKNNNFLNIGSIFTQYFSLFNKAPLQKLAFFVAPIFMAVGITKVKLVDKDIINNLNIVLSILISMFFALLSILCSFSPKDNGRYNLVLKETFNVVMIECILGVFLLIVSFVILFINQYSLSVWLFIVSILMYYLALIIFLNILLVIKRMKKLFDHRFNLP